MKTIVLKQFSADDWVAYAKDDTGRWSRDPNPLAAIGSLISVNRAFFEIEIEASGRASASTPVEQTPIA